MPHVLNATLELCESAVVLDDEIGTRAFELGRHLRRDHVHGLRFLKATILDESIETHRAMRVDEDDSIETVRHVPFEQQRNVADDDSVAALARLLDETKSEAFDLGMDDLVKFFELRMIGENDPAQRGTIEVAVRREDIASPAGDDLLVRGGAELDRTAGQNIGIDDCRAAFGKQLRDGRFSAADVSRESYQEHDGFLG